MSAAAEAFVAVGSNIAPSENVPVAVRRLGEETELVSISTFYRTRPVDRPEQPDFRNGVVRLRTHLSRRELEGKVLKTIEEELGRKRTADLHAARTIDLDLAVYCARGDVEWASADLESYNFVAAPVAELAHDLRIPPAGHIVASIARRLGREGLEADPILTRTLREKVLHELRSR